MQIRGYITEAKLHIIKVNYVISHVIISQGLAFVSKCYRAHLSQATSLSFLRSLKILLEEFKYQTSSSAFH